jgi:hypothetical protein
MAAIAPVELIKISTFTVGVDTYPDIRSLTLNRAAPSVYRYRGEASMTPTKITPVASDQAPVTGRVSGKTLSMDALSGVGSATATVAGINAVTGAAVTVTITAPQFLEFSGGGSETQPENSSLGFEATGWSYV